MDETAADADGGATADGRAESDRTQTPDWRAVFWDIGGVVLDLRSVRRGHRRFVEALVDELGLGVPPEEAVETWREAVGAHFREREGTEFRAAREAYARGVAAVAGGDVPEERWRPLFADATAAELRPEPGAVEIVSRLAETDLHVGVISDVDDGEGRRILAEFGLLDRFDSITTSEAVGRTKPDPAMFEAALSAAGVAPERSLMVGDRLEHDARGAREAGMHAALYDPDGGPDAAAAGPDADPDGDAGDDPADYRLADLRDLPAVVGVPEER